MNRNLTRFALAACISVGCATTLPTVAEDPAPPEEKTGDPVALGLFIDAKLAELRGDREKTVKALQEAVLIDTSSVTLYNALARNLVGLERFEEAISAALRAVALDERNIQGYWTLHHALMQGRKDTLAAAEQLEKVTRIKPDEVRAYDSLRQIYASQNRKSDVLRILDRIVEVPTLNTRYRLFVAETFARLQEPERAARVYEQVLTWDPDRADLWTRLGTLWLSQADTLRALKAFRSGLKHSNNRTDATTRSIWQSVLSIYESKPQVNALLAETPLDVPFIERLSDIMFLVSRRPDASAERSHRCIDSAGLMLDYLIEKSISPMDRFLGKKAEILMHLERPKEARQAFRRAIQFEPRAHFWLGVAHSYLRENNLDAAVPILERLHKDAPTGSPAYSRVIMDLAFTYSRGGRLEEARELFLEGAKVDPDNRFQLEYARTYMWEKDWATAIETLAPMAESFTSNSTLLNDALFALGQSYERVGRFQNSVDVFQRLIGLDPENHEALNYLGYMFAEKGIRLAEAEAFIRRALVAEPKNGAYLDSLGWIYYRQARYDEARKQLLEALRTEESRLEKEPNERRRRAVYENLAIIHEHAGDAAKALGRIDEARKHWMRAAEYDPDSETVLRKIREMDASSHESSHRP